MALIRENNIELQWETEEHVPFNGNRELLSRLLTNLVSNAYRYGRENGHILVQLKKDPQHVLLTVSDDGVGIEKEEQPKIFQRFYQSDSFRSGAGLGLGLPMAYEIARFHGGEIRVESAPGEGSVFTVILPCGDQA